MFIITVCVCVCLHLDKHFGINGRFHKLYATVFDNLDVIVFLCPFLIVWFLRFLLLLFFVQNVTHTASEVLRRLNKKTLIGLYFETRAALFSFCK